MQSVPRYWWPSVNSANTNIFFNNSLGPQEIPQWRGKVKVKVWTLAIAPLTWVRLVTSSALQSRKWQLIGMSQWCRSALCGHPLSALTDNWTHGAARRHTIAPISHTRRHPVAVATTHFPSSWGWEAELAWAHSRLATCSRLLEVDRVWVELATSRLRVRRLQVVVRDRRTDGRTDG